jgi:hypothetical protein
MKCFFFIIAGLMMLTAGVPAQDRAQGAKAPFTWDLVWAGSWEESKNLLNRGDFRLGLTSPGLILRTQALDKHTLNFELDQPWGEPSSGITSAAVGLYHRATGSRILYGVLDEWGLPARVRSPWIRSAPYTENHQPVMADLRTTTSSTKNDELYLYLSSPRLSLNDKMSVRGFGSAQFPTMDAAEGNFAPAFSGGLETVFGRGIELLLEGFYTGRELPARNSNTWFSDPPPLPVRDFRLGAAAILFSMPYISFASDWAWSETFAWGAGVYGSAGIRISPPFSWNKGPAGKPGPWSLSLAADGMSERYVGRDGTSPGGGLRTAGKIEWKGPRSSLFKVNTTLRGPALDEPFERSSSGIYYRFPAPTANATANSEKFPLRASRVSLNASRNASNIKKIYDDIDFALGLSLNLPPMLLPPVLLPASARKVKNPKPKNYPLNINLSTTIKTLGSAVEVPPPYPFLPVNAESGAPMAFDSTKTSAELLWSPGIFQFRTRWGCTAYAKKDTQWDGSISASVRFQHSRFSAKFAWPVLPEKWNCTLSWRVEK